MKRNHSKQRSVIINLKKTPIGYQIDEPKKPDNKKLQQLLKSNFYDYPVSQGHSLYNPDSIHKSEFSDKDSQVKPKTQVQYKVFQHNLSTLPETKLDKIEAPTAEKQIPIRPQWFEYSSINQRQKDGVDEFFKGNQWKTPNIYVKYRNFIVQTYELNPSKYLSKIACRRVFHGDACSIIRIHQFLEQEGVINRGINQRGSMFQKKSIYHIPERLGFKKISTGLANEVKSRESKQTIQFEFKPNFTSKILSKTTRALCPKCNLPTGIVWVQMKTNSNNFLCLYCWSDLPPEVKEQFQRKDVTKHIINPQNKNKWQMEEHGKLLGSLSVEGITWDQMFERVPNKNSKQDIIFHYMQLPSANIETLKPPKTPVVKNNQDTLLQLLVSNYEKSIYSKGHQKPQVSSIELSPLMAQMTVHKLKKFAIQLQNCKDLDELNYRATIIQNPVSMIARAKMLRQFQADQNFQNLENQVMMESQPDMEPMNLGEDNFFTTDFNNDNFGRFDDDDDMGGIFNVLND